MNTVKKRTAQLPSVDEAVAKAMGLVRRGMTGQAVSTVTGHIAGALRFSQPQCQEVTRLRRDCLRHCRFQDAQTIEKHLRSFGRAVQQAIASDQ